MIYVHMYGRTELNSKFETEDFLKNLVENISNINFHTCRNSKNVTSQSASLVLALILLIDKFWAGNFCLESVIWNVDQMKMKKKLEL